MMKNTKLSKLMRGITAAALTLTLAAAPVFGTELFGDNYHLRSKLGQLQNYDERINASALMGEAALSHLNNCLIINDIGDAAISKDLTLTGNCAIAGGSLTIEKGSTCTVNSGSVFVFGDGGDITVNDNDNQIINGSSGDDKITININGVEINGGEGNDTIIINGNNNTINCGDGFDEITLNGTGNTIKATGGFKLIHADIDHGRIKNNAITTDGECGYVIVDNVQKDFYIYKYGYEMEIFDNNFNDNLYIFENTIIAVYLTNKSGHITISNNQDKADIKIIREVMEITYKAKMTITKLETDTGLPDSKINVGGVFDMTDGNVAIASSSAINIAPGGTAVLGGTSSTNAHFIADPIENANDGAPIAVAKSLSAATFDVDVFYQREILAPQSRLTRTLGVNNTIPGDILGCNIVSYAEGVTPNPRNFRLNVYTRTPDGIMKLQNTYSLVPSADGRSLVVGSYDPSIKYYDEPEDDYIPVVGNAARRVNVTVNNADMGAVDCSENFFMPYFSTRIFKITANDGYHVEDVTLDGVSVMDDVRISGENAFYTLKAGMSAVRIDITFAEGAVPVAGGIHMRSFTEAA